MTTNTGLIVPVDVAAYCVGVTDAADRTGDFAGATTNYENQVSANPGVKAPAFLGVNVTRDHTQAPAWPLESGVHLHWAMPDALTHANNTSGDLSFLPLPNRWLVTRVVISGKAATGKSWIVESDTVSTTPPENNHVPTLPVQEADSTRGFRYVGARQILDDSWSVRTPPAGQTFKDLFRSDIHTVASGDIAFAAFYPNSRNIFGFYDDLADLAGASANLMYVVTGWFSDASNDPLSKSLTLEQIEEQFGWTFDNAAGAAPLYSLYNGTVQGIEWNPDNPYIADAAEVHADVAVGNNPAEALAAYFRGRNNLDQTAFEQLFTLFEAGLLSTFKQPQPGQLAELVETLHERQFSGYKAGVISTIVAKASEDIAPSLPLLLGDALNLLNQYQQEADLAAVQTRQYKWQLFADWYRLFLVNQPGSNAAFNSFSQRVALWKTIQQIEADANARVTTQQQAVTGMLGDSLLLKQIPAPRYLEPNEPVVLLAGKDLAPALRYGGDGRYHPSEYLVCRLTSRALTSITLDAGSVAAAQFTALLPSGVGTLPYSADVTSLLQEAALLNTALVGAITGDQSAALDADLQAWLEGTQKTGKKYQTFGGALPSRVCVQWWATANPWFPLTMIWQANFHPLMATNMDGALQDYPPGIFVDNYVLDPSQPGKIKYSPGTGAASIIIDPKEIDFDPKKPESGTQAYQGTAILSSTSADNLEALLTEYTSTAKDGTLKTILTQLGGTNILMQALSGLNNAMLMREQSLQLSIGVPGNARQPYKVATSQTLGILDKGPSISPIFNGTFNPFRAGYMQLDLKILDAFGEVRPVTIDHLYISESLSTYYKDQLEPGIIYLQPRLSQESRLLFRWLAADTTEYDEMNAHPATSPVCGWVLPNHLVEGFFFYNQQGNSLGSLTLNGDGTAVVWQAAPGNDNTVDQTLEQVMQYENPHLRDLASALASQSTDFFTAFWNAMDTAAPLTAPVNPNSEAGLAVLVGRPVALVQVSLLLQQHGTVAYNQSWNTLDESQNIFVDTANQIGAVQFPVVLGDLQQIDDGLVGYFKQDTSGAYDTTTFYSEAAPATATSGVMRPPITNVLLTPASTPEGSAPSIAQGEHKILMLMDPRAGIHATMGILPTQFLQIPPEQYVDTLAGLEVTFLASPILKQGAGLALPLGVENGFTWSWIEETRTGNVSDWTVIADIEPPSADAVWQYSPQNISEGWLRLNPNVLQFTLLNRFAQPTVDGGTSNALSLTIKNLRQATISFRPAAIVNEGVPPSGSLFYIHFGGLVAAADVASIQITAAGWTFQSLQDARYGSYWGATPIAGAAVDLAPGASLNISLTNIKVSSQAARAQVYFAYYNVAGDNDGVAVALLTIEQPALR